MTREQATMWLKQELDKDDCLIEIPYNVAKGIFEFLAKENRQHGKWIERHVEYDKNIIDEWQSALCSRCGKYHTTPYMYYFNDYDYCPNCGAIMDSVEGQHGRR